MRINSEDIYYDLKELIISYLESNEITGVHEIELSVYSDDLTRISKTWTYDNNSEKFI